MVFQILCDNTWFRAVSKIGHGQAAEKVSFFVSYCSCVLNSNAGNPEQFVLETHPGYRNFITSKLNKEA